MTEANNKDFKVILPTIEPTQSAKTNDVASSQAAPVTSQQKQVSGQASRNDNLYVSNHSQQQSIHQAPNASASVQRSTQRISSQVSQHPSLSPIASSVPSSAPSSFVQDTNGTASAPLTSRASDLVASAAALHEHVQEKVPSFIQNSTPKSHLGDKPKSLKRLRSYQDTKNTTQYNKFTPVMAWNMCAAHTWPAAILPVGVAIACAASRMGTISISVALCLLLICVLMQSSANVFNDYYDYVKGTDDSSADVEETDAVLVYNNVNPRDAFNFAAGLLVVAFVIGIYIIIRAGFIPLVIALIGAAFVVMYSSGKTPISYLPIGEVTSGFVMGGLIPLASYLSLTNEFSWLALLWGLPTIIGIALIMMTNNTCDIERDKEANRQTLPVLLGRDTSRTVYHVLVLAWLSAIVLLVIAYFFSGIILLPFMLLSCYPLLKALFSNPLSAKSRVAGMSQICGLNIALGAWYIACILLSMATFAA